MQATVIDPATFATDLEAVTSTIDELLEAAEEEGNEELIEAMSTLQFWANNARRVLRNME